MYCKMYLYGPYIKIRKDTMSTTKALDEKMMMELFKAADTNRDNTISLLEFETFVNERGSSISHEQARKLFKTKT